MGLDLANVGGSGVGFMGAGLNLRGPLVYQKGRGKQPRGVVSPANNTEPARGLSPPTNLGVNDGRP